MEIGEGGVASWPYIDFPGGAADPAFSPDARRLAYTEDERIAVVPVDGRGGAVEIGLGRSPRWHPDGRSLAFLRGDGPPRVWLADPERGGAAEPVSPKRMPVAEYAWSPDGRAMALLEAVELDRPGVLRILDDPPSGAGRAIALPPREAPGGLCWSPDGRTLTWHAMTLRGNSNAFEIRLLDVRTGDVRPVVPLGAAQTRVPVWRPDAGALAMQAAPQPYGFQALFGLATWSAAGGIARPLAPRLLQPRGIAWSPDGRTVYVSARNSGATRQVYAVSVPGGETERLTDDVATYERLAVSPDGRWLACERRAPDMLPEIVLLATDRSGARRVVTDASRRLGERPDLRLGTPELVRWRSADGLELEGLLLWPPGYGPGRRPEEPLPTIVDVHGGPIQLMGLSLGEPPLYLDGLHHLAAHGYLCFSADYRRAGGYGWGHLERAIEAGDCVGLDPSDILSGVDHLVARGLADPGRLGLRGFSYGGYLANWLLTRSGRFRAIVSVESAADLVPMWSGEDPLEVWLGGSPAEVPERYRRYSPLTYAAQASTPALLVYGAAGIFHAHRQDEDFRAALEAAGVEVELLVLPGDGHFFARPENLRSFMDRTLAWFDGHMSAAAGARS